MDVCTKKYVHDADSSFIYDYQVLESTKMSLSTWKDK